MKEEYFDYIYNIDRHRNNTEEDIERRFFLLKSKRKLDYLLNTVIILAFAVTSVYVLFNLITGKVNTYMAIISIAVATLTSAILLLRYLQVDKKYSTDDSSKLSNNLLREFNEIKLDFQKFKKKAGMLNDDVNIDNIIGNIIRATFTEDYIQSKIEKTYSDNAIKQSRLDSLFSEFEKTSYRINDELIRLRKSANLNLVIGALATTIAIISLTYEVFIYKVKFVDFVSLLSHYIPRVSLVIFVEIFAFFFLRLYKANLNEIKYFNNEKTNIDMKLMALKTALYQEDAESIKVCLSELIKTERNFVLKKDESTVEIEKWKSENDNNKIVTNLLSGLLSKR